MTDLSKPLTLMVSPPICGDEPPIDVAHLARMTLGEQGLEIQVLELFDRQAELLLVRMRQVAPAGVASLAHTLSGSARGIGAWRVATAAEALERAAAETGELAPAIERLAAAVNEARLAIRAMLRGLRRRTQWRSRTLASKSPR
jgi:HPt (histidine-containing phosphotransfer) domain-containing protein